MTDACIGWKTDTPCPMYGEFHGCRHDDNYQGQHECLCGERTKRADVRCKRGA